MNARFSIWSQFYNTAEPEEAILEFEKDGISYIELSSEHIEALLKREGTYAEIGREFANFCLQKNIKIHQAHLIFPSNIVTDSNVCDSLVNQLEMLDAMGVRCAVLHLDHMKGAPVSYEEKIEHNIEALRGILSRTEGNGVRICIENLGEIMRGIDEILYVIEKVGSDRLGVCLDTGHLNLTKTSTQREFILKADRRLGALHIADNEGVSDQHIIPFGRGHIDFFEVAKALDEVDYDGLFNYEIGGDSGRCPTPVKHFKYKWVEATYNYIFGK